MALDPQNLLEEAMVVASRDPDATPSFLRALAEAEVFVPQERPPATGERGMARPGEQVELPFVTHEGRTVVPVFSSLDRLQAYVPQGTSFIRLRGRDLASLWPADAWLALNPRGDLGTMLSPQQVRQLAGTAGPEDLATGSEYVIGQPREEPRGLLEVVELFCRRTPEVKAAYRGLLAFPRGDRAAQIVIGLEVDEGADMDRIRETLLAAGRESGVDSFGLVPVRPADPGPVAAYLLEKTEPFYRRGHA
jgi:SseB protein N-terminal domain/SseB protein C-terminal domain